MKFGISFLPDADETSKPASTYFREALTLCDMADQANLSTVKMTEHYLHTYGGYCPSPLAFLSSVASRTNQIRLMTGCILPAFHHPIQIAAETAMLDAISDGRLDVGFGRAYLPYEFEAFGISIDESRERYVKTIDAVIRLWTEKNVSAHTPYFAFANATSLPHTVQRPHPPVWGAAVNSRQSFAWLGERGFNLLVTAPPGPLKAINELTDIYREAFREAHATGRIPQVAISLPLYIAESTSIAAAESEKFLQDYVRIWANAADSWSNRQSRDYPGYTDMAHALRLQSPRKMLENNQALVGSPEQILEKVLEMEEELNVDLVLWQIDYGSQPFESSRRTLQLFVDQVLTRL